MPRVKYLIPPAQLVIEDDLRARYGGMMTAAEVGRELGLDHPNNYSRWLRDLPFVEVNGLKRWRVSVVAEKMHRCTHAPED